VRYEKQNHMFFCSFELNTPRTCKHADPERLHGETLSLNL